MKITKSLSLLLVCMIILMNVPINILAGDSSNTNSIENGDAIASGNSFVHISYKKNDNVASEKAIDVLSQNIEADFEVVDKWNGGFNGLITIRNTSDSAIENWQIEMEFSQEIINIWDAVIVSNENNIYTIKNSGDNNGDISVNGSVTFGFLARYDDKIAMPKNVKLLGAMKPIDNGCYSAKYDLVNSWNDGFNAQIILTNNTDRDLENWYLEFEFDAVIDNIWNGIIEGNENGHYTVSHTQYNATIAPFSSIIIGYTGHWLRGEPADFVLMCSDNSQLNESANVENESKPDYNIDSDKDGLSDGFEISLGTLIDIIDTDGDEISDYNEVIYGFTSPLLSDSNNNGILDCCEDFDGDKLSFVEEIKYGTNPNKRDSDDDTLSDYDEVNLYSTNPTNYDSDFDSLSDADELSLGFNPNKYDSDNNGICDANEKVLQTKNYDIICEGNNEIIGVDVKINMCGNIEDNLKVTNVLGIDEYSSNLIGLIGVPIDITCYTDFDDATITYKYDKNLVDDEIAKKLGVLSFDENTGTYENKNAIVDIENGTVTFSTTHFCSMSLCNLEEYNTAIADIPDYVKDNSEKFANSQWQGDIVSIVEAASILGISQSDLTATAKGNNLYILKYIGVYNLIDGRVLEIPHIALGIKEINIKPVLAVSQDLLRNMFMLSGCECFYTKPITSDYEFGTEANGSVSNLPYKKDINTDNPGYITEEARYFIPQETLDKTDTDKDGLYDVYEYLGMRMTNGQLFYTNPKVADVDNDKLSDGQEIRSLAGDGGLFTMYSNPLMTDSDGDNIDDYNDKYPLKSNIQPNIFVNSAITIPNNEVYSDGKAFYFSAYAVNNSFDKLENFDFELKLYYGNSEKPKIDEYNITDPSQYGIMVVEESTHGFRHMLPKQYAEKTWKLVIDDSVDLEKIKCLAVFKTDTKGYDNFYSTNSLVGFLTSNSQYESTELEAYAQSNCLAPEIRGERTFSVCACVQNDEYINMHNVTATIAFSHPEGVEMLDEFYTADLTKCIDKIYGRDKAVFHWEIRVKDGVDLSDIIYSIQIKADGYNEKRINENLNFIDGVGRVKLYIGENDTQEEGSFDTKISADCYDCDNLKITIQDLSGKTIFYKEYKKDELRDVSEVVQFNAYNRYKVTAISNYGTENEKVYTKIIDTEPVYEFKSLLKDSDLDLNVEVQEALEYCDELYLSSLVAYENDIITSYERAAVIRTCKDTIKKLRMYNCVQPENDDTLCDIIFTVGGFLPYVGDLFDILANPVEVQAASIDLQAMSKMAVSEELVELLEKKTLKYGMTYTVYELVDNKGNALYVGRTRQDVNERFKQHLRNDPRKKGLNVNIPERNGRELMNLTYVQARGLEQIIYEEAKENYERLIETGFYKEGALLNRINPINLSGKTKVMDEKAGYYLDKAYDFLDDALKQLT